MTFEDPTQLARCIKSDCQAYRAGNTPLCAAHLREQEVAAGATSIVEPELEARARLAGDRVAREIYVGPDPDTNGLTDALLPEPPPRPSEPMRAHRQKMARIEALCRELMAECGIYEADDYA